MPEVREYLQGIAAPFPGLRRFERHEAVIFRGRETHVDALMQRLGGNRFLAVVGTSGSGKSSLVRAGLLPALERGHVAGMTKWRIAVFQPGTDPIANLATALQDKDGDAPGLTDVKAESLREDSLCLVDLVRKAALQQQEALLVVVDQFEELFAYHRGKAGDADGSDAPQFVRLLLHAVRRPDVPVYVLLTMRSDYLGDCAEFPGLPEYLTASQYLVPRLTREQRRQAIREPLLLFGVTVTQALLDRLLNDSGEEAATVSTDRGGAPDPLPVLQHALLRTFEAWQLGDGAVDIQHYDVVGGMADAINRHGEDVIGSKALGAEGRKWAERIFRCVTTMELGRKIRRPTKKAQLLEIIGCGTEDGPAVEAAIQAFRDARFLQENSEGSIDISHESVIWKWNRLSKWVEDEAESAKVYSDLVVDSKAGNRWWVLPSWWSGRKLSDARKRKKAEGWNGAWGGRYEPKGDFRRAISFLFTSFGVEWGIRIAVLLLIVTVVWGLSERRRADQEHAGRVAAQQGQDAVWVELGQRNQNESRIREAIRQAVATGADVAGLKTRLAQSEEESKILKATAQSQKTGFEGAYRLAQVRLEVLQRELDAALREASQTTGAAAAPDDQEVRSAALRTLAQVIPTKGAVRTKFNAQDGLTYVWIAPGTFTMGCSPGDSDCTPVETPAHQVTISKGFWIGRNEVTQGAWRKVMGSNPSAVTGSDQLPVDGIRWEQADEYCRKIGMALPTAAEWEYAARGGTKTSRYGEVNDVAWYGGLHGNSDGKTHEVSTKAANSFGLYDMLGNVAEWTASWFEDYGQWAVTDPPGPTEGTRKELRGGSYLNEVNLARSSGRSAAEPTYHVETGVRCRGN